MLNAFGPGSANKTSSWLPLVNYLTLKRVSLSPPKMPPKSGRCRNQDMVPRPLSLPGSCVTAKVTVVLKSDCLDFSCYFYRSLVFPELYWFLSGRKINAILIHKSVAEEFCSFPDNPTALWAFIPANQAAFPIVCNEGVPYANKTTSPQYHH